MAQQYWLVKSEPESYSIDALKKDKETAWTGVRNFQARNFMQAMRLGDPVFFYHSSCAVPGVYGTAKVTSTPYPDPTQFDTKSPYFDKRATKQKPLWYLVNVAFVSKLPQPVTLAHLRSTPMLTTMKLLQAGSRLSVSPVTKQEYDTVLSFIVKKNN